MPEAPRWLTRINPLAAWRKRRGPKAGWRLNPPKVKRASKPRTYRPIHLATLVVLTVLALTVTGLAAWLMWNAAQVPAGLPNSPDLAVRAAQLRVDVIRNILAVGAGTGGLIALFLALRRQYVKERVDYSDQEYKNRTAEDSKHDATERRVTDLYVKAAEQLGSDKAAVRLAALYALERLGQDNPEHRQTIIDLICAYLRMPYSPPSVAGQRYFDGQTEKEIDASYQEFEVRFAAQKVLTKHLRYSEILGEGHSRSAVGTSLFWSGIDVDLSGADLRNFSFNKCAVSKISLSRAKLLGRSDFRRMYCDGFANFAKARFSDNADFSDVVCDGFICDGAEFVGEASFYKAKLGAGQFVGVTFSKEASFRLAHAFIWEFEGARASLYIPGQHVWPKGFGLTRSEAADTAARFGDVVITPDPHDPLLRDWREVLADEAGPNPVVPQQPTDRDPVDPQPSPDSEG